MGLTTAFSASGLITVSSDREAGKEEDSGRERCTGRRRDKRKTVKNGVAGQETTTLILYNKEPAGRRKL